MYKLHLDLVDALCYNLYIHSERRKQMDYMTVKEAAEKWGYSEATVRKWCREEKLFVICKAIKKSGRWQIPKSTVCPMPFKSK